VRGLLGLKPAEWLRPLVRLYPILARAGLRPMIQRLLMPPMYLEAVRGLGHGGPHGPNPRGLPSTIRRSFVSFGVR
jgi:hypothetical protein